MGDTHHNVVYSHEKQRNQQYRSPAVAVGQVPDRRAEQQLHERKHRCENPSPNRRGTESAASDLQYEIWHDRNDDADADCIYGDRCQHEEQRQLATLEPIGHWASSTKITDMPRAGRPFGKSGSVDSRLVLHLQTQAVTGLLMTSGEFFVEFDSEPAAVGRACTPFTDFNRVADQFDMNGPSFPGGIRCQQVGSGCRQLEIRSSLLRSAQSPSAGSLLRQNAAMV